MKKALIPVISLFIILGTVSAFAAGGRINVDGYAHNSEWLGCDENALFTNSSNTKVSRAYMKYAFSNEESAVYYLFTAENAYGIYLGLDDADEIILKDKSIDPDAGTHIQFVSSGGDTEVLADMRVDGDEENKTKQFYCEVRVIYLNGKTPRSTEGRAGFFDKDSKQSAAKSFSCSNAESESGTSSETENGTAQTTKKHGRSDTVKTSTKHVISTSRVQTTAKPRTTYSFTAAEITSEETQAKTTKAKATKAKTTKPKTTKAKTAKSSFSRAETSAAIPETVTVIVTVTASPETAAAQTETEENSAFELKKLPKSSLMKILAGAGALVIFGAVGVSAVRSNKNGTDDETTNN